MIIVGLNFGFQLPAGIPPGCMNLLCLFREAENSFKIG